MTYKMKKIVIMLGFAIACLGMSAGSTCAQYYQSGTPRSNWFPNQNPPTLSPWLEMERATSSDLDAYHQYVRPRLELERQIIAQQRQLNLQEAQQQKLSRQVTSRQSRQSGDPLLWQQNATPTGKSASYRDYSHYYPGLK